MRSKKAILNIISSLALQAVVLICGLIVPRYIIETFGSDVNGLIASITQFLAYIALLESGIGPVIKAALYKPIANKDKKQIENILGTAERFFRVIALIFIGYLTILSCVYPMIVNTQFNVIFTVSLILIISISTLAEYYLGMTYKLYLQAEQKTYITSGIQILGCILNTVAIIVLIKLGASIQVVKLVSSLIFVLRPLLQNIYVRKKYNINLKKSDKSYKLEQKWNGLAQHIASVIHENTDIAILTIFTELAEVSVYSVYYLVIRGVRALVQAFTGGIDASFGDMIAKGEKEKLNNSFNIYEILYFTIISFVWICTLLLIVPFVKVYTLNISDANYIRPLFAVLIVLSEFVWTIRLPYSTTTLAAGHFKETQKGAWVECIVNLGLSLILVYNFGIVGVAIGTLVAMVLRTTEFVYHISKYILKRSIWISVKKIILIAIETLLVVGIMYFIPNINVVSYSTWILQALITSCITGVTVLGINAVVYKKEMKNIFGLAKSILKRKRV